VLPQRPRTCGQDTSGWTLARAADGAAEPGLSAPRVSAETLRAPLARRGVRWRRAKEWSTRPAPQDVRNKARRARLLRLAQRPPDGLLGFADEVWGSRLAQPARPAGPEAAPPVRLVAPTGARDAPAPTALACDGLVARSGDADQRRSADLGLRCGAGRPVRAVPSAVRPWGAPPAPAPDQRAVLLIGHQASGPERQSGRSWIRPHKRPVQQAGDGVRVLVCDLPRTSPGLHPLDPQWLHGQRKVLAPARLLTTAERGARVCAVDSCPYEPHLIPPKNDPRTSKKAA
jgi:hypothetical protein